MPEVGLFAEHPAIVPPMTRPHPTLLVALALGLSGAAFECKKTDPQYQLYHSTRLFVYPFPCTNGYAGYSKYT